MIFIYRLTKELKERSLEKKKIIGEVENKQSSLENLKPSIGKIMELIKPVAKILEIEDEEEDHSSVAGTDELN